MGFTDDDSRFADFDGTEAEAASLVVSLNEHRRHLTAEFRRQRVKELRSAGKSEREIATDLGIAKTTVHRDLTAGGPCGPPAPAADVRQPLVEDDGDDGDRAEGTADVSSGEGDSRAVAGLCEEGSAQPADERGVAVGDVRDEAGRAAEKQPGDGSSHGDRDVPAGRRIDAARPQPAKVTGRDGKTYAATQPHKPAGKPEDRLRRQDA